MLKVVKTVKKDKDGKEHVFMNIYLFGVAIRCVNKSDYLKLYYSIKGYLNGTQENQ